MESHSPVKSMLNRQRDDSESEQRKSQCLESSAEPEHTTKIIDLNDDCLMKIFGHLDLQCLFNVAIANEWLRPAAQDVYSRKFGTQMVKLSDFEAQSKASVSTENKWCNRINVTGLKPCLLYLRCFGPAITNLRIDYNKSESKRYSYVHQYINDLTRIKFYQMPNIGIGQFQKVFAHVEDVVISGSVLGVQWLSTFVECFPNLHHLKIKHVDIEHGADVKKSFEHLEHLEIIACNELTVKQLVTALLRGVHRLNSLKVEYIFVHPKEPISVLLDMTRQSPQITKLVYNFWSIGHIPVNSVDVQRIAAEHAALVELRLANYRFTIEDVFTLLRELCSLKDF